MVMNENKIIENIVERTRMKIAISKFNEEEKNNMKTSNKMSKTAATILIVLGLGTGIVYATTNLYDKIWKEPESFTYEEMLSEMPPAEVTEEEKKELITEKEAEEKGLEILEKLGYKNQTINRVELKRGYSDEVTSYYMIKTKWGYEEGLMVQLDANGGDFIAFNDMDLKYKHLQTQILTDEEIAKVATDIYEKLGIEKGKYEYPETKVEEIYFENQKDKLLGANFYKYYDGIKNKYESFNVSFLVVDGKIFLNSILLSSDNTYQKNPLVITEEEAVNIAKNKEQEFSPFEITKVTSDLSIEKMNAFIYQIENNKYDVTNTNEEETYYKTENIARKVWKIKIEHNIDMKDYRKETNKYVKEGMNKIYFIDATTGEIIGGTHTLFED